MTFLAEWGDRSQISTIALASSKNPVGVTIGGVLGHCICKEVHNAGMAICAIARTLPVLIMANS
ncbi:conserved hypothetical protein [Perkinsus marinus ATCC 50983]|uniref:GDT1 family protein n=1 Tax=Perkinsus marinus (strain ATCC 50983 / TXsc) TaxID=423536 RepID=C5KMV7_PERM5|nr:conserved hypothetical protein [Perkinsus marinus ATCC 50983]EER14265.1 conserved hypothetical protein [Perkinsus marinus ATCC 50983]|eukprot:XP_002782470.1 conserved hypothetical protein [Perkinsus marinus ATCC 50983]